MADIPKLITDLVHGRRIWDSLVKDHGLFLGQETTK